MENSNNRRNNNPRSGGEDASLGENDDAANNNDNGANDNASSSNAMQNGGTVTQNGGPGPPPTGDAAFARVVESEKHAHVVAAVEEQKDSEEGEFDEAKHQQFLERRQRYLERVFNTDFF